MVFDLAQELIDEDYHRADIISARYMDNVNPFIPKQETTKKF